MANSKADYLFYPAAGNLNATMARAMYDTGYKLKYLEYITAYGSDFIEVAGAGRRGRGQLDPLPAHRGGGLQPGDGALRRVDGPGRAGRAHRHVRRRRLGGDQGVLRRR